MRGILDNFKKGVVDEFKRTAKNSYLVKSIKIDGNVLTIEAPQYNMREVGMKGLSYLKFDNSKSYADDVDERGGKIFVHQTITIYSSRYYGGKRTIRTHKYVFTGNHIGYIQAHLATAIYDWAKANNLEVEKITGV